MTISERRSIRQFGSWPAWLFLAAFLGLPLGALFVEALSEPASFERVVGDGLFGTAIRNTLLLGLISGALSTLVGVAIAIELSRQPESRRRVMMTLLGLPLAFSGLVIAFGFILAFGRAGLVTQLAAGLGADAARVGSWLYSVWGLGFAYAYYLVPRVALSLYPVFSNLDERPMQAARTLGASRLRAFWDTVVPEVLPSVITAATTVSALAMGTYGTALALVGTQLNILPLLLFARVSDGAADFPAAAAMSLILMGICMLVLAGGDLAARFHRRSSSRGA
ncbi:ABC transporter permease [Polaromonas sp. YR568]|uniref:ABC transporter permease n=1 Tax=Polaromonas sp. YR568 TaxID=1855301 RepID=UPI00398C1627